MPSLEGKELDDFNPAATAFKPRGPLLLDMLASLCRTLALSDFSMLSGHLPFPSFLLLSKEVSPWHVLLSEQKNPRVPSGDSPLGNLPLPPTQGLRRVNE